MSIKMDFHAHTTISDGTLLPEELVEMALERGMRFLAITDHDRLEAIAPARQRAQGSNLTIISGVEVSTASDETTLHILGLFVNENHKPFRDYLEVLFEARQRRMATMVERLRAVGYEVTLEEVFALSRGGSVGRNHLAKVLLDKKKVGSYREAFETLLSRGKPGFVPYEKSDPRDAIQMIREAGGLSFLAHPGIVGKEEMIEKAIAWGIDGLEVIHPKHDTGKKRKFDDLCRERALLRSGGSDYHGPGLERKGELGEMNIPPSYLEAMQEKLQRRVVV